MAYYSYCRVSTSAQAEKGQGLDTQKNQIQRYCMDKGINLTESFTDAGISGTTADRDGLNELLSVLNENDTVIVANTSRLWRSDSVKVLLHHELKKNHVNIVSVEQPTYDIYTQDPNDFLFNGMMELLDQYERMTICKKLARGRKTKARNGSKACGTAPFGYKWQDNQIVIDYNNNLVIQSIYDAYSHSKSYSQVKRMLDEKGLFTSTGKAFSVQAIKNIIANDFYTGIVTHAGKKSQGTHEPIISRELWDSCQ